MYAVRSCMQTWLEWGWEVWEERMVRQWERRVERGWVPKKLWDCVVFVFWGSSMLLLELRRKIVWVWWASGAI